MLRVIAGALAGIAFGGVFSFLFFSANWQPHTAEAPLVLQVAIGLTLGATATYRIRRHGLGFVEGVLLGIALSIFASLVLIVWVVTGV